MLQAVIWAPLKAGVEEAEVPRPGPGQLLVRCEATGISAGTEMVLYTGANPDLIRRRWGPDWEYPMYPGYQAVGTVVEVGAGVEGFAVGDRVVGGGRHAELALMAANQAARLPEGLDAVTASTAIIAGIALHGVRRADIVYGERVAIVGLGMMGQLAAQHARLAGAGAVIGVDPDPARRALARELGVDLTIDPEGEDPVAAMLAATDGVGADAVIETAGVAAAVPLSLKLPREYGRVVVVGFHARPIPLELAEDFLYKELDVRASRSRGPRGDLPIADVRWTAQRSLQFVVDLLASRRLHVDRLISHRLPGAEIGKAYELIRTRAEPTLHVVLTWAG